MRRSGPRTTASISLFPFLAVLMCTMGALLVVLVAIARNARQQALEEARLAQPSQGDDKVRTRDSLVWRIEQLRASHQATQAELAEARHELAHLEAHARRLRSELAALAQSEAELANRGTAHTQNAQRLAEELAAAEARLEETGRRIRALEKQTTQQAFAVIPYEGPHGTRRRPIYIECRAESVIVQPEGIELTEADFLLPIGPASPLAAALRAANEVSTRRGLRQEEYGQPYPLLLVRPDGVGAYYAARSALAEWGNEFGYELIDADWNLEFPPPDPELQQAMQLAVAEARARLKALLAMAPRRMRGLEPPKFGSTRGEPDDPSAEPYGAGRRRLGARTAQGRSVRWIEGDAAGLLAAQPQPQRNPYAEVPLPGEAAATSASERGQPERPDAWRAARPGSSPGAADGNSGRWTSAMEQPDSNAPLLAGGGDETGSPWAAEPEGSWGGRKQARRQGSLASAGRRPDAETPDETSAGDARQVPFAATAPQDDAGQMAAGSRPARARGSQVERQLLEAALPPRAGPSDTPSGIAARAAAAQRGSSASLHGASAPDGTAAGSTRQASASADQALASDRQASSSADQAFTSGRQALASADQASASASASSAAAGGTSATGEPAETPIFSLPEVTLGSPPQSLAVRRGRDWGLPRQAARATPVTRPIKLRVEAERLVVRGENPAGRDQRVIPMGENTLDAVDELAAVVAERVETWGMAGRGMYWRPLLVVEVAPGGEARFAELQALLADSGLDIRRVPLRTADRRASYPRTQTPD